MATRKKKKNVTYKVWVHIEEITTDKNGEESYEDVGMPEPLGVFETEEAAADFISFLPTT